MRRRSPASTGHWPMGEPAALAALMLDAALGWPGWLHARIGHPVGGFARIIGAAERRWNREAWSGRVRRWTGFALLLQIGRASCRERVCQVRVDLGGRRSIKKKKKALRAT